MTYVPDPTKARQARRYKSLRIRLTECLTTEPRLPVERRRELAAILVPEDTEGTGAIK